MTLHHAVFFFVTTMMLFCCTPSRLSIRYGTKEMKNPSVTVQRYCTPDRVTAFGRIRATSEGEVVSGAIEAQYAGPNATRIVLYSPLGAIVGSIVTRNDSLVLEFGEHWQIMALSDPFTSDLFSWGGSFRCNEVVQTLCGRMIYCDSLIMHQPAEIIRSGLRNCYIWKTSDWECDVYVTRWRKRLRKIELKKRVGEQTTHLLRLSSFTGDGARMIMMKVDDRNYFTVEYEQFLRK